MCGRLDSGPVWQERNKYVIEYLCDVNMNLRKAIFSISQVDTVVPAFRPNLECMNLKFQPGSLREVLKNGL